MNKEPISSSEIIKQLKTYIELWGDMQEDYELNIEEANQILSDLEWKGCDGCKWISFPVNSWTTQNRICSRKGMCSYRQFVDETTSCIHYIKKEEK